MLEKDDWIDTRIPTPPDIEDENFIDLASREAAWLTSITEGRSKISADEFYQSHRTSALGEISYRNYILEKMMFILKYTNDDNKHKAMQGIVLGKNVVYDVPIEFTRHLIKSIKERAEIALKKINLKLR